MLNYSEDFQRQLSNETICAAEVPYATYYFKHMSTLLFSFTLIAALLTLLMIVIYIVKMYYIFKYMSGYTHRPGKIAWLGAIYPYTAAGCLVGLCVPRAITITDIFILLYLARCMFVYIELVIDYFGSRLDMATQLTGRPIQLNIRPLCRCCICCPLLEPTIKNIRYVELLVYQVAVIRPLLFLINGVAWSDKYIVSAFSTTITVLNFASTITAMYGFMVIANICRIPLRRYRISVWMKLAQIVIVLFNLQMPIFNLVASFGGIPCTELLPTGVRAQLWNNFLLIFELFLLSLASAWLLRPTVNAMFDRHPINFENSGPIIIKPKASIKYYNTEPSAGNDYTDASSSNVRQNASDSEEERNREALPLLK